MPWDGYLLMVSPIMTVCHMKDTPHTVEIIVLLVNNRWPIRNVVKWLVDLDQLIKRLWREPFLDMELSLLLSSFMRICNIILEESINTLGDPSWEDMLLLSLDGEMKMEKIIGWLKIHGDNIGDSMDIGNTMLMNHQMLSSLVTMDIGIVLNNNLLSNDHNISSQFTHYILYIVKYEWIES